MGSPVLPRLLGVIILLGRERGRNDMANGSLPTGSLRENPYLLHGLQFKEYTSAFLTLFPQQECAVCLSL